MMLLGISGKRGVGKTTLATYFVHNHGFTRLSYADSLKDIVKSLFPALSDEFNNPALKEKVVQGYDWTPRELMCRTGDFLRFHDESYFIKSTLRKLKDKKAGRYIIDDVRFPNEAEAIKKLDGMLIRINRYEKKNPYGKNLDIPSETSLDEYTSFDYLIDDCYNTSLPELYSHADKILKAMKV